MNRRMTFWLFSARIVPAMLAACGMAAAGGMAGCSDEDRLPTRVAAKAKEDLPVPFDVPDFTLTERDGSTVTRDTLAGNIWVAGFIFTHCPGPCPTMTMNMRNLQTRFRNEEAVRLVLISVDPERDTPERLREYAGRYNADPEQWLFLTGDRREIFDLSVKGFKLAADAGGSEEHPVVHSQRFVLIDWDGRIRQYFDGTDPDEVRALEAAIRRLLKEKASGD